MNLVVGATGQLGLSICRRLIEQKKPVRALVREPAHEDENARKAASVARQELEKLGVEVVIGDLKGPLPEEALRGVRTVISTASSTMRRQKGDTIKSVDEEGQLRLVDAAKKAKVKHFVFVSFHPLREDFPLQRAKRAVEDAVRASGMVYTILQPTFFMESWLWELLNAAKTKSTSAVPFFGDGRSAITFISVEDVARFAVASVDQPAAYDEVLEIGGPAAVTPKQVLRMVHELSKHEVPLAMASEKDLREQLRTTTDTLQQSFAALALNFARGAVIDARSAHATLGIKPEVTVRTFIERFLGIAQTTTPPVGEKKPMPNVTFGPDDIVIYADDGKFYVITKDTYTQSPLPDELSGEAYMLVKNGTVVANMPNEPGVGCACYLLNTQSLRKT